MRLWELREKIEKLDDDVMLVGPDLQGILSVEYAFKRSGAGAFPALVFSAAGGISEEGSVLSELEALSSRLDDIEGDLSSAQSDIREAVRRLHQ